MTKREESQVSYQWKRKISRSNSDLGIMGFKMIEGCPNDTCNVGMKYGKEIQLWVEAIREDGLVTEDPQGLGIKARSAGTKPTEN